MGSGVSARAAVIVVRLRRNASPYRALQAGFLLGAILTVMLR